MYKTIIFLSLLFISSCKQNQLSGYGSVIDGDGILLNDTVKVRLWGIDAPEYNQPCYQNNQKINCGEMSSQFLKELIDGKEISCTQTDTDRYGRIVATCYTDDNIEINKQMVAEGWAFDYTYYSNARYRIVEYKAKLQKKGLWQYQFDLPHIWRQNNEDKLR